jgi:hypothetical protein
MHVIGINTFGLHGCVLQGVSCRAHYCSSVKEGFGVFYSFGEGSSLSLLIASALLAVAGFFDR